MSFIHTQIGIIGGGQISQLLTHRAHQLGYHVTVLAENAHDPAAQIADRWIKGKPQKKEDVAKLSRLVDYCFFENEVPSLKSLEDIYGPEIKIENFVKLNDRWTQKELLWDYNIPQVPYMKINGKDDIDQAFEAYSGKIILKSRIDLKGEQNFFFVKNKSELETFKKNNKGLETSFIVEKHEALKSEFALILFRNRDGEVVHYPPFHVTAHGRSWIQVDNLDSHRQFKILTKKIVHFLQEIDHIGPITFEIGKIKSDLAILAVHPRLTSFGMVTLDGFNFDQFEMYLRSITNQTLPKIQATTKFYACRNIIGSQYQLKSIGSSLSGKLYWYNKRRNRPGRKLGHVNYVADSKANLLRAIQSDRRKLSL